MPGPCTLPSSERDGSVGSAQVLPTVSILLGEVGSGLHHYTRLGWILAHNVTHICCVPCMLIWNPHPLYWKSSLQCPQWPEPWDHPSSLSFLAHCWANCPGSQTDFRGAVVFAGAKVRPSHPERVTESWTSQEDYISRYLTWSLPLGRLNKGYCSSDYRRQETASLRTPTLPQHHKVLKAIALPIPHKFRHVLRERSREQMKP